MLKLALGIGVPQCVRGVLKNPDGVALGLGSVPDGIVTQRKCMLYNKAQGHTPRFHRGPRPCATKSIFFNKPRKRWDFRII